MDQYTQPSENSPLAAAEDRRPDLLLSRINQMAEIIERQGRQIRRLERDISELSAALRSRGASREN